MQINSSTATIELEHWLPELQTPGAHIRSVNNAPEDNREFSPGGNGIQELQPADGGVAAWRLLITAFIFEALFWGFPTSFGVFQDYYTALPQFASESKSIVLIGTLSQGICWIGAPLSAYVTQRFPRYHRLQIIVGWTFCITGLVAGSFVDTVPGLIVTQGVMYGIGFLTFTYPIIAQIDEWWIARKGMAFGLISAASGATGCVMPFILTTLLERFGYQTTLRAIAVAMAVTTAPLIPLLKSRLPKPKRSSPPKINLSFVHNGQFWIFLAAMIVQGYGFFIPGIYLPSYATALGLSPTLGALLLALLSASAVAGQFAFGWLSDKHISVSVLTATCSIVSTAVVLGLWGTAKSLGSLIAFSMLFGFFAYGFGTMRVAMGRAVSDDPSSMVAIYSIFVTAQGVGNVCVQPISNALLKSQVVRAKYGIERYGGLIFFAGMAMAASAVVIGIRYVTVRSPWRKLLVAERVS